MRFVSIKSIEQPSCLFVHLACQGYVEQRTALIDRIRGLLSELGLVPGQYSSGGKPPRGIAV